jgi:hypothetical protein
LIAFSHDVANTIVVHLDVFKDHLPGLFTGGKAVVMQTFRFERAKEALHRRIDAPMSSNYHRI